MTPPLPIDLVPLGRWCEQIGVHYKTGIRYALKGVRGHTLRTHLVGGRRFVSRADAAAWLRALNARPAPTPPETDRPRSPARAAEADLERLGY